jgi:hypothetical protein
LVEFAGVGGGLIEGWGDEGLEGVFDALQDLWGVSGRVGKGGSWAGLGGSRGVGVGKPRGGRGPLPMVVLA